MPTVTTLSLDALRLDGDIQPRAQIDPATVQDYAEALQAGAAFPPVDVFHDGRHYWLAEGFHRYHAARRAGRTALACTVHVGTAQDARWFAVAANQTHGLRRSNADKRRAVAMALAARPDLSDRAIAEHCGVSHPFVADVRAEATGNGFQSEARTGRDGRTINVANIGKRDGTPRDTPGQSSAPAVLPPAGDPGTDEEEGEDDPVLDPGTGPVADDQAAAEALRRRREAERQQQRQEREARRLRELEERAAAAVAAAQERAATTDATGSTAAGNAPGVATPAPAWQLVEGRCEDVLPTLTVRPRLVFADPPYNLGFDYGPAVDDSRPDAEYLAWAATWIRQCFRLLADDGSLWVLISDEYAAEYNATLKEAGFTMRSWVVWYETFGVNCTSKFNRCKRHLFYAVKNPAAFVFNREAVSRPSDRQLKYNDPRASPEGKVLDDVWTDIPRLAGTHVERIPTFPTQLPLALLRRIVACASDPGDLVLDPFNGSGTTGVAALRLGRSYLGCEVSAEFARLARLRLQAAGAGGWGVSQHEQEVDG